MVVMTMMADVEFLGSNVDVVVNANTVTVLDKDACSSEGNKGKKDNLLMDLLLCSVDVTFFLKKSWYVTRCVHNVSLHCLLFHIVLSCRDHHLLLTDRTTTFSLPNVPN